MPAKEGTALDVVAEWQIGPKSDIPGIICILHHLPFEKLAAGADLATCAVILTPQQAREMAHDLLKAAALFPEHPNSAAH